MTPPVKVAGISFDHMHMGDNLRMAFEHQDVEIVGVCDPQRDRMDAAVQSLGLAPDRVFQDYRECLERTAPDLVVLCPATAAHADWIDDVAPFGVHVLIEKPFAASLEDADRMIATMRDAGRLLAINWPLAWYPCHVTTKRLLDDGAIGAVRQVDYYDGNRGPLWHLADKAETSPEFVAREKAKSWFYRRDAGGGSLLDYLGYGATLGTWFLDGQQPLEVTTVVDAPPDLEVDEHSVTIARYETGLCRFETRWGTFTDPWTHQPQPKCGFVIQGTKGTITSYDYEDRVTIQTLDQPVASPVPVDRLEPPHQNPIQYLVHCVETGSPLEGPLSPEMSRIGQRIVDAAVVSAREKRTVPLLK